MLYHVFMSEGDLREVKNNENSSARYVYVDNHWENDESDWVDFMYDNPHLKKFEGKRPNAATILHKMSQAMDETFSAYEGRGLKFDRKSFGVIVDQDEDFESPQVFASSDGIAIVKEHLEELSNLDFDKVYKFYDQKGALYKVGTLSEISQMMGWEEANHIIFRNYKPGKPGDAQYSWNMTMAQYDAIDLEWRSLVWRLRKAKQRNFSKPAIEFLEQRVEAARQERSKRFGGESK